MEREMRMRLFVEEYSRLVSLFDDIVNMRQSMARLEFYMVIMVLQVGCALTVGALILSVHALCRWRRKGVYKLEHRFERDDIPLRTNEKKQLIPTT